MHVKRIHEKSRKEAKCLDCDYSSYENTALEGHGKRGHLKHMMDL
jgi:hypothetical protein